MKTLLIIDTIALGIAAVAMIGLLVLYLQAKRKLAKYERKEVKKRD